jgi:hypothetical protein
MRSPTSRHERSPTVPAAWSWRSLPEGTRAQVPRPVRRRLRGHDVGRRAREGTRDRPRPDRGGGRQRGGQPGGRGVPEGAGRAWPVAGVPAADLSGDRLRMGPAEFDPLRDDGGAIWPSAPRGRGAREGKPLRRDDPRVPLRRRFCALIGRRTRPSALACQEPVPGTAFGSAKSAATPKWSVAQTPSRGRSKIRAHETTSRVGPWSRQRTMM